MKYVISGVTGLRNRGVEALVLPIVLGIKAIDSNASITVITYSVHFDQNRLRAHGVEVLKFSNCSAMTLAKAPIKRLLSRPPSSYERMRQQIADCDTLIVTGGDVLSSDYNGLDRHLVPVNIAIKNAVPVVLLAHSLGPFKAAKEIEKFRSLSSKFALVTLREQLSYEYAIETLKIPESITHLTADVAFLLKPEVDEKVARIRKHYGLVEDKPTVALGVSGGVSSFMKVDRSKHLTSWKWFITGIQEKYDAQILIVPHVQEIHLANDDRFAATKLVTELSFDENVHVASLDHTASEYKGLISSCDMVVSERMHACIAGLSTATPTIAVKYSVKAEGIMNDFFADDVPDLGVLIDFADFLDTANAMRTFDLAWSKRDEIRSRLNERLPDIVGLAEKNFDLLRDLIS